MKKETPTSKPSTSKTGESQSRKEQGATKSPAKPEGVDFATLDLTIDRVDERVSPSETNIFDK